MAMVASELILALAIIVQLRVSQDSQQWGSVHSFDHLAISVEDKGNCGPAIVFCWKPVAECTVAIRFLFLCFFSSSIYLFTFVCMVSPCN